MRRTYWLASYPKSGNTWLRLLIANVGRDAPADINAMPHAGGIASARSWFDRTMLFASGLLTHDETDRLRPRVYQAMAQISEIAPDMGDTPETRIGDACFVKSHDAYTHTADGEPLLGGACAATGVILIVRDPRDVAPSLASHTNRTVDRSIDFMASAAAAFCDATDRQPEQLRQQLPGWDGYNATWLDQRDVPLHLVRYEDLQADTVGTLTAALAFAGIDVSPEEAATAVRFAGFAELRRQEAERGFREAPRPHANAFFRRGVAGAWHDELTPAQAARIETDHGAMMARLGYRARQAERMAM